MPNVDNDDVLTFLCSHFVPLALETRPLNPNGGIHEGGFPHGSIGTRNFRIFSGFVIEVRGLWFLMTAGHIVQELEERLARGEESLVHACLVYFLGPNARNFDRAVRHSVYRVGAWRTRWDYWQGD